MANVATKRSTSKRRGRDETLEELCRRVYERATGRAFVAAELPAAGRSPSVRRRLDEDEAAQVYRELRDAIERAQAFASVRGHRGGVFGLALAAHVEDLPRLPDPASMHLRPDPAEDNARTWFVERWPWPSPSPRALAAAWFLLGFGGMGPHVRPIDALRAEEKAFGLTLKRLRK